MKQKTDLLVLDRIEGSVAVLERGSEIIEVALGQLPKGVAEGSVLRMADEGYVIDDAETRARRAALFKKQSSIFKRK